MTKAEKKRQQLRDWRPAGAWAADERTPGRAVIPTAYGPLDRQNAHSDAAALMVKITYGLLLLLQLLQLGRKAGATACRRP